MQPAPRNGSCDPNLTLCGFDVLSSIHENELNLSRCFRHEVEFRVRAFHGILEVDRLNRGIGVIAVISL